MAFQYPEYLRRSKRYCPEFDYYSLGIVLLEIGYWKLLDKMTEDIRSLPEDMLAEILRSRLPRLEQYMGAIFRDVIGACLT